MGSRPAFTILEALITMGVLLASLLLVLGLTVRFMIVSEYSLATVNLSDELLKASMRIREELLKIGPRMDTVQLFRNGIEVKGVEGDEVRFEVSIPFGGEESFYSKTVRYSIKFDGTEKKVVIMEQKGDKPSVVRVLAENIEDCRFRMLELGTISFSIQKREKRMTRTMSMTVSLFNTK